VRPFDYVRPTDPASAVAELGRHPTGAYLGGGTNLVDHLRLGVAEPDLLVDVSRLDGPSIDDLPDGGIRIGAGVRNSELAADERVRHRYPVLARALLAGANGQLRNVATTAGNLLQRTRCVYFQDVTTPCNKRDPGSGCSAIGGYTRHHAILGTSPHCIAVHPSDMAVGMAVLDVTVEVLGIDGAERRIPFEDLHRLPGDRPEADTNLRPGDLITAVELAAPVPTARSTYLKVRDRASFAFALVSVAASLTVEDQRVTACRLALGGVAHKPWRARAAEDALLGARPTRDAFAAAADLELVAAEPVEGNEFKVPMARGAIVAALGGLTEVAS